MQTTIEGLGFKVNYLCCSACVLFALKRAIERGYTDATIRNRWVQPTCCALEQEQRIRPQDVEIARGLWRRNDSAPHVASIRLHRAPGRK